MTRDDQTAGEPNRPKWDETPMTLNLIQSITEAHPEYTLTSQIGADGNRYVMLQFFDGEPNQQAASEFVSMVSDLDEQQSERESDTGDN